MHKVIDKVPFTEEEQLILVQNCTPTSIARLDEEDLEVIRPKKKGANKKIIDDSDE
jgi:hypothetical protein